MAWPESMFLEELNSRCGFYDEITPLDFIYNLIDRCEFITIAMEPNSCGNFGESFKILRYLDKYIFQGNLGTSSYA
jgi:hypothetical protein